jgi:hypothetical protein
MNIGGPRVRSDLVIDLAGIGISPNWSYALYANPPSHDFLTWLLTAEIMRRANGGAPPLKVAFLLHNGMLGARDFGNVGLLTNAGGVLNLPVEYSNQMLAHVLRPAIDMLGAVNLPDLHAPVKFEEVEHFCEYTYFLHTLVDAARAGFQVPLFNAPDWAKQRVAAYLGGKRPLVITLRETTTQPERNNQIEEWIKFAESVEKDFPVLFLRDTQVANFPLGKWPTWPLASVNAYIRLALYQQALCNFMVGNGPMGWCSYSDAPYLMFKQLIPSLPNWEHGTAAGWERLDHIKVGENMPWANPKQKFTWKDDTFENIREEFEWFLKI